MSQVAAGNNRARGSAARLVDILVIGRLDFVKCFCDSRLVGALFIPARVQAVVTNAESSIKRSSEIGVPAASMTAWTKLESWQ